ncbi:MAG: dihydroorotase [Methanothrix sp.]|nr:dihydroorotase [Methanothrix sp.]
MDINFDLAVKNGRVFTAHGQMSIDIWVKDGRIAAMGGDHRAEERIDARGMLVLPGAIDAHVHFRDPGPNYKEDWASGSGAAVAGGVTTVIDQPNTSPRTIDAQTFAEKLDIASHRSRADFCLNGGPGNIDELAAAGAAAIGEIFSYEHSDEQLQKILGQAEQAGILATLHAEDGLIIKEKTASLLSRHDAEVYSQARPAAAEAVAIDKCLGWATSHLHICHLSSAQGLERVARAKKDGKKVTSEATPHHLLLNIKDYKKQGSYLKMNPPLRLQADNDALWQGLRCGTIDILASDHAPHLPEEKKEDIWEAPAGVPGVETMLPMMLMAVKRNLISLGRLVDAVACRPARIFGLVGKGSIEAGKDADLVIVDTKSISQINANRLHSRADWTPFQGRDAIFPQMTLIRGNVVYDGEVSASPGYGRFLGKPRIKQKVL